MSGRPYARNPRAPYTGPRDLEAILPHTFRLEAPVRLRDAKHAAIRRAIRRRCLQKNWRKLISIRYTRVKSEMAVERRKNDETHVPSPKDGDEPEDAARQQVQDLELKLQGLTDQKHAKFQLLKAILTEEARSKGGADTKKRRPELPEPSSSLTTSPAANPL